MRTFESADSLIYSLRSRKSQQTKVIKGARQQVANARGFNFNRVAVEDVARRAEQRISLAKAEIARLDARIAHFQRLREQSFWIERGVPADPAPTAIIDSVAKVCYTSGRGKGPDPLPKDQGGTG